MGRRITSSFSFSLSGWGVTFLLIPSFTVGFLIASICAGNGLFKMMRVFCRIFQALGWRPRPTFLNVRIRDSIFEFLATGVLFFAPFRGERPKQFF
ncbi:MAG: hypothetical protein AUJ07_03070 [Crenarchaeota archaeon 13_1_40CM_3_53_5]|nr:MAG: hypothetical protein AUJ07_03070 [Crenarchaeota archaeon 13_1_40CM_3_53_5]